MCSLCMSIAVFAMCYVVALHFAILAHKLHSTYLFVYFTVYSYCAARMRAYTSKCSFQRSFFDHVSIRIVSFCSVYIYSRSHYFSLFSPQVIIISSCT